VARKGPKVASVDFVPDEIWVRCLRSCSALVLHHPECLSLKGRACDCTTLLLGPALHLQAKRAYA
jgi:hypothetical protein